MMKLQEVVSKDLFEKYYISNKLATVEERTSNLIGVMKIRAMQSDEKETAEEILSGLEEVALRGNWQSSW